MKPPGGNYAPTRLNVGRGLQAPGAYGCAQAHNTGGFTTAKVMSATPPELILIMFEQFFELIPDIKRNILRGSAAATEPDAERAQAIVEELINSLDFSVEMSKDIGAIYFYVRDRILEANIQFSAGAWDHVESIMRPLYEAFKEASLSAAPGERLLEMPAENASIVAGVTYGKRSLNEFVVNSKSGLTV